MTLRLQKAWHDYTCVLCGGVIKRGEKYWRHYVDKEPTSVKEHINCVKEKQDEKRTV